MTVQDTRALTERIEDALGVIAGCGDIRFNAEIDEARADARKALAELVRLVGERDALQSDFDAVSESCGEWKKLAQKLAGERDEAVAALKLLGDSVTVQDTRRWILVELPRHWFGPTGVGFCGNRWCLLPRAADRSTT